MLLFHFDPSNAKAKRKIRISQLLLFWKCNKCTVHSVQRHLVDFLTTSNAMGQILCVAPHSSVLWTMHYSQCGNHSKKHSNMPTREKKWKIVSSYFLKKGWGTVLMRSIIFMCCSLLFGCMLMQTPNLKPTGVSEDRNPLFVKRALLLPPSFLLRVLTVCLNVKLSLCLL